LLKPDRDPLEQHPIPNWSIGGGIAVLGDGLTTPSYLGAFERRLGTRTWVILGLLASRDATESPRSQPGGGLSNVPSTTTAAQAQLGLRYVLLQSIVDVSGELAVFGKYRNVGGSPPASFGGGIVRAQSFGVLAGISAERELVEGLALRLTLRLARGSVDRATYEQLDNLGVMLESKTSSSSLALVAEPALALYFYF
jgi:hypothetical protein